MRGMLALFAGEGFAEKHAPGDKDEDDDQGDPSPGEGDGVEAALGRGPFSSLPGGKDPAQARKPFFDAAGERGQGGGIGKRPKPAPVLGQGRLRAPAERGGHGVAVLGGQGGEQRSVTHVAGVEERIEAVQAVFQARKALRRAAATLARGRFRGTGRRPALAGHEKREEIEAHLFRSGGRARPVHAGRRAGGKDDAQGSDLLAARLGHGDVRGQHMAAARTVGGQEMEVPAHGG